jgi:DNA-binding protein H-NS
MINLENLTPTELQALLKDAQTALEQKQSSMRKEVIAQIKELAASINVTVEIIDDKKAKKAKSSVAAKYANPNNSGQTWTGRGLQPKWLKVLIAEGRNIDDFLIGN